MSDLYTKTRIIGNKKQLVTRNNTIDNIYSHAISKAIVDGSASDPDVFCRVVANHVNKGGNIQARDSKTGETFFHVLSQYAHHYMEAKTVRIFYYLGTKIDLDVQEHFGDTVLHKICLLPGAWRCIVAVMRCGSSPFITNNSGLTAEDLIIQGKREKWEENLHWLKKYSPGIWHIPKGNELECANGLAERFLKTWCRPTKIIGDNHISLKNHILMQRIELICAVMLEKYELTNEVVIALLSGSTDMLDVILNSDGARNVDVNVMDDCFQYNYRGSPTAPRPLLMAVWEMEDYNIVKRLLALKPDTAVKYTFEAESTSPPKPLFFHLVNPKSRPDKSEITEAVLQSSDLSLRNEKGETILFEAIYNNETEKVIQIILDCGVDIAARDLKGRTARDHCNLLGRNDYKGLIDSHVIKLTTGLNITAIENLILHMYNDIPNDCKAQVSKLPKSDHQVKMLQILKNVQCMQTTVKKLFGLVRDGNFSQFWKLLSSLSPQFINSCDKAGRSFLHCAVQSSASKLSDDKNSTNGSGEDILDDISTMDINTCPQQIEPMPDTDKLQPNSEKKRSLVTDLFSRKNSKQDYLGIVNHLVKQYPCIARFTNNLGQTALHSAFIFLAGQSVVNALESTGNCGQVEDIFGYLPKDYNRDLCGEQTFQCRRKPVDEMDLNIFLTESQFEHHLKKSIQTGYTCCLKTLINPLIAYGGVPYYNHMLFDCIDAKRISLASYLIHKGFKTDISKQYDVCNPDNPMCAMMECSHPVTTLRQRAEEVGATDLVTLIDKRGSDHIYA